MKFLLLIILMLFSTPSVSALYKCKQDDGSISYQGNPCPEKAETLMKKERPKASANNSDYDKWELIEQIDEMTNNRICVIESGNSYVGKQGSEFLFVRVRITLTDSEQYIVGLYSSSPLSDRQYPPSFHNDIDGLGIKVDDNQFISVDRKASQRVLGFDVAKSKQIVSQLHSGNEVKLRVRFWPYDQTHDGGKISMRDFENAIKKLKECSTEI